MRDFDARDSSARLTLDVRDSLALRTLAAPAHDDGAPAQLVASPRTQNAA